MVWAQIQDAPLQLVSAFQGIGLPIIAIGNPVRSGRGDFDRLDCEAAEEWIQGLVTGHAKRRNSPTMVGGLAGNDFSATDRTGCDRILPQELYSDLDALTAAR